MSRAGPAQDDEEYVSQQPTAEQRAAVSREMTNMLHKRIEGIMYQFKVRRTGLSLDAEGSTHQRYSDLANDRMQDPDESHPPPSGNRHSSGYGGYRGRVSGADRGFFSDDRAKTSRVTAEDGVSRIKRRASLVGSDDGRGGTRAQRKQRAKANRLRMLKTLLHEAESKLMGRMVDAFTFAMSDSGDPVVPFEIPVLAILQYAGEMIRCPYSEAHFKKFLTCEFSCSILETLFWYIHCYCFQAGSQELQERLLGLVSHDYVHLLQVVTSNKDYFFENFPYAMAFAVCTGFHYFVPGSRSRFTPAWRLQVYVLVCRVLCGMDVCAVTVQRMQETLFEEERPVGSNAEKDGAVKARRLRRRQPSSPLGKTKLEPPKDGWESLPGTGWGARLGALRQLPRELSLPALDQTKVQLSGPGGREPCAPPTATQDDAASVSSGGSANEAAAPTGPPIAVPQGRQLRLSFSASTISGLVKRYLGTRSDAGKQNVMLKRTAPVPWVRVGGVDTFHPELAPDRSLTLHALQERHGAKLAEFMQANREDRNHLRQELNEIKASREEVLQGGVSCVSKFCLDLSDSKADQQKAAKSKRKGKNGVVSSSDAIASRYRNTREERLAAHLNTLPAPSALTTHYTSSGAHNYSSQDDEARRPSRSFDRSFAGGSLAPTASGVSLLSTTRRRSVAAATAKAVIQSP